MSGASPITVRAWLESRHMLASGDAAGPATLFTPAEEGSGAGPRAGALLDAAFLAQPFEPTAADRAAAWQLAIELRTRISTQELHPRSGDEEAALASLRLLFERTREVLRERGPESRLLAGLVVPVLNQTLRPLTARWHRRLIDGHRVRDDDRRTFRVELAALQFALRQLLTLLGSVAEGEAFVPDLFPGGRDPEGGENSGARAIPFDSLLGLDPADADRLLEHERPAVVRHRRAERASGREEASADGVPSDLVGLAISGGGIRSATFAQGVLGRLAREDLLPEFDYLSTVSGGGYFGSFLSSYWCAEDPAVGPGSRQLPFHEDGQPEPRPLRYIRNRSKVLLDGGLIGLARALWPLFYGVLVNVLVLTPLALFLLGLLLLVPKLAEDADQVRGMLNRAQALFAWIGALLVLLLPLTHRSLKARRVSQHEFLALAAGGLVALLWLLDQATVWVFPRLEVWQGDLERFIGHHPWAFPMILLIAFTHFIFGNINWSSLHGYYRRRLASAFILRRGREGEEAVEPRESQELRLSDLGERGPYHLINAAVNLPTCGGIDLRGRKSDFFLLSRFFCGSPSLGYCRTDQLEKRDPELDLGTAMAISGAAASPHMGVKELRGLSFWLALFNIRLSYWIPNPKELQSGWHRLRPGVSYVLRELTGWLNDRGPYVNVSDGGHIENLGVYELLRRRCRFIVAIDGEADPEMRFDGLMRVMRYATIDLGVDLEVDLGDLAKNEAGLSRGHYCLGKIRYPAPSAAAPRPEGLLLYIKLSVTGNEPAHVLDYGARHPSFPHQTTADQLFDESQFEAYRALGEHLGDDLLRPELLGPGWGETRSGVREWFRALERSLVEDEAKVGMS